MKRRVRPTYANYAMYALSAVACLMVGAAELPAFAGAAGAPGTVTQTARTMTVDDTLALLKAGVSEKLILRQIAATGTRLALSVPQILKLKSAGASDALLAALMGPLVGPLVGPVTGPVTSPVSSRSAGAAGSDGPSIRVYREKNENGEEVLHVTNLDASGKRIGGELDDWSSSDSARSDGSTPRRADRYDGDGGDARQPPVIVNVYPPSMQAPPASGFAPGVAMDGAYLGGGSIYTGGLGVVYNGYRGGFGQRRRPACDNFGGGSLAEPGLFSRPSAISTLPYRANTAAQRNRVRFGNR